MPRKYIPKKGSQLGPFIAKFGITFVAREMGVSQSVVRTWLEADRVPWAHISKLSRVIDEDINLLLPIGGTVTVKTRRLKKTPEALDTLERAFRGEPYEIKPPLTAHSLKKTLETYGDRVPLVVETLKQLINNEITVGEAAERLKLKKVSVHSLRARYGGAPGPIKKVEKPIGRYKQNAIKHREVSLKVISGQLGLMEAAEKHGIALRTLSRYVQDDLDGVQLRTLASWPLDFRIALAHEIEHELPKITVQWAQKCKTPGWKFGKNLMPLPPVTNWREATVKRMLIAVLTGELSVNDLAALRGGEPTALHKLFDMELKHLDLTLSKVLSMSIWHQVCVADMLRMSGGVKKSCQKPDK